MQLSKTSVELPILLEQTQAQLQTFLTSAQTLSLERYDLADRLTRLVNDLGEEAPTLEGKRGNTVLTQLEGLQDELGRFESSMAWVGVVERVVLLRWAFCPDLIRHSALMRDSETTLNAENHRPSALAALPHYRDLQSTVLDTRSKLPAGMALLSVIEDVRVKTWQGLKDLLSKYVPEPTFKKEVCGRVKLTSRNLQAACEAIKWPLKVDYPSLPALDRRRFERAYLDLLYLQAE